VRGSGAAFRDGRRAGEDYDRGNPTSAGTVDVVYSNACGELEPRIYDVGEGGRLDNRRRLIRGAFVAIGLSAAGLATLVYATGGRQLLPALARLDPRAIGFAVGLMGLYWACDAGRMMALSAALGGDLRALHSLRVSLVGAAAANLTPFNSGGEALQAFLLSRCGLTIGEATAIVAVKTFFNAVARLFLGLAIPAWLISVGQWYFSRGVDVALRIGLSLYACVLAVAVYLILRPEAINVVVAPLLNSRIVLRALGEQRAAASLAFVRRTVRRSFCAPSACPSRLCGRLGPQSYSTLRRPTLRRRGRAA